MPTTAEATDNTMIPRSTLRELASVFASKQRPAFRGTVDETKGPQMIVMNDSCIPCMAEEFGDKAQMHVNYGIMDVESTGFQRVPITHCAGEKSEGKWKTDSDAKPLAQRNTLNPSNIECFPWEIEPSPMNKGPRVEDEQHNAKFQLHPGMTIRHTLFRDPPSFAKGARDQELLPKWVIGKKET